MWIFNTYPLRYRAISEAIYQNLLCNTHVLLQSIQGSPQKLFCHILVIRILNLHKNEYKAQNYLTFKFLSNHTAEINQNSFNNWPQRYPHCLFIISTWLSSSHLEVLSFVISENGKKNPNRDKIFKALNNS